MKSFEQEAERAVSEVSGSLLDAAVPYVLLGLFLAVFLAGLWRHLKKVVTW